MTKQIEEVVDRRLGGSAGGGGFGLRAEHESQYLRSRRSIRIWPVSGVNNTEESVRAFFMRYLKTPADLANGVKIESVIHQQQARRSKIHHEMLVISDCVQSRDAIQSYAPNLADTGGAAGLRLDVPDFLRGTFRQFEAHGAALRAKFGVVKRSIRFDDVTRSLLMDVKLEHTQWHRITAKDMRELYDKKRSQAAYGGGTPNGDEAERDDVLLLGDGRGDGHHGNE